MIFQFPFIIHNRKFDLNSRALFKIFHFVEVKRHYALQFISGARQLIAKSFVFQFCYSLEKAVNAVRRVLRCPPTPLPTKNYVTSYHRKKHSSDIMKTKTKQRMNESNNQTNINKRKLCLTVSLVTQSDGVVFLNYSLYFVAQQLTKRGRVLIRNLQKGA